MQITAKRLEIEKKIQRLEALDTEVGFDTLFGQKTGISTARSPNTSNSTATKFRHFWSEQVLTVRPE